MYNVVFILIMYISSCTLAIFYPGLKSFFSLLGGFFGTLIVVVFPGMAFLKFNWKKSIWLNVCVFTGIIVVIFCGFTGAIIS